MKRYNPITCMLEDTAKNTKDAASFPAEVYKLQNEVAKIKHMDKNQIVIRRITNNEYEYSSKAFGDPLAVYNSRNGKLFVYDSKSTRDSISSAADKINIKRYLRYPQELVNNSKEIAAEIESELVRTTKTKNIREYRKEFEEAVDIFCSKVEKSINERLKEGYKERLADYPKKLEPKDRHSGGYSFRTFINKMHMNPDYLFSIGLDFWNMESMSDHFKYELDKVTKANNTQEYQKEYKEVVKAYYEELKKRIEKILKEASKRILAYNVEINPTIMKSFEYKDFKDKMTCDSAKSLASRMKIQEYVNFPVYLIEYYSLESKLADELFKTSKAKTMEEYRKEYEEAINIVYSRIEKAIDARIKEVYNDDLAFMPKHWDPETRKVNKYY